MKTHWKTLKNPNYLGSWDLFNENGEAYQITTTITGVKKDMVHDGKGGQDECIVMGLKDYKPMILNSTNLKQVSKKYGNFIEDWNGKSITIGVEKIKAFGEMHDALRILKGLPDLNPKHPIWSKVKEAVDTGKSTIAQVRTKYELSKENETLLCLK